MTIYKTILLTTILATATPLFAMDEDGASVETCKSGALVAVKNEKVELVPDYKEVELNVERKPGLFALYYPEGSKLTIGDKTYDLTRITFHTPAEHLLRGHRFDLEVQLEHKNAEGKIAVVSIMMKKGFSNFGLNTLISKMPKADTEEPTIVDGVFFSPQTLFPADLSYAAYTGPVTTPPCADDAQWYVLKAYVELGADQLSQLKKAMGNSARADESNHKILKN